MKFIVFMLLVNGCAVYHGNSGGEAGDQNNYTNCYEEPKENRCGIGNEPLYCHAPQESPFPDYCDSAALDTGTNIGSEWCCYNHKVK